MHDWKRLSHVKWECKYHVVFVPKYRKKKLYGKLRSRMGEVELLGGHLMPDHVHMCLSIPPKFSVSR